MMDIKHVTYEQALARFKRSLEIKRNAERRMAEEWKAINDQYRSQAEEALKKAEAAKDLEIAAETDQDALDQYCMIVDDLEKIVKDLQEIKSIKFQNKIHKDLRSKYGLDPMGFIE